MCGRNDINHERIEAEKLKIAFLNVGYGEAIVVRSDEGHTIVIDGGSKFESAYAESDTIRLEQYLTYESIDRIDLMVMTHIHDDHIGGLVPVVERWPVGEIWCNILPDGDFSAALERLRPLTRGNRTGELYCSAIDSYADIRRMAAKKRVPMRAPCGGETFRIGSVDIVLFGMGISDRDAYQCAFERMIESQDERVLLKRFYESDCICNNKSLALMICEGKMRVLLTADRVLGWDTYGGRELKANVLKISHHGQADGMPDSMLFGADPEIIVICTDRARTFNSANPCVIERAGRFFADRGKVGNVYITGDLNARPPHGNVLELSWDEHKECVKASIKKYDGGTKIDIL